MGIYRRAVATVAAVSSGSDPTYGLPGVSAKRHREPHNQIAGRVGDRILVSGPTLQRIDRRSKDRFGKHGLGPFRRSRCREEFSTSDVEVSLEVRQVALPVLYFVYPVHSSNCRLNAVHGFFSAILP